MFRIVSFVVAVLLVGAHAYAQDKAGKVVSLDYSNPVVRNVRFTRQSDRPR
ncbi:MAG: hypothetical protein QOG00_2761 [Pyrinomonadaceae bacterium]|nr:hypothetical protein [Pyrinomonadaceae bacterium]